MDSFPYRDWHAPYCSGRDNDFHGGRGGRESTCRCKISGCEIDLIIAGTISPDYIFPSLACEVQAAIGAKSATAFDLSAGCSGFLFALATADAYFRTGRYKHALVIGAETLSKMMNWADRSTCVLFGDGAGAAVVSAEGSQLLSMVQGSDGAGGMVLHCENRPVNNLYRQLGAQHYAFTQMDGREVYKFAVRTVPKAVSEALEQAELPIEDVKYFLLHQANIRIIESVAKRLHQPMENSHVIYRSVEMFRPQAYLFYLIMSTNMV